MNPKHYLQGYDPATDAPEEDDGYCPTCAGTGEGQYDGSSCSDCKGRGYRKGTSPDDFQEPDDAWDLP